MSDFRLNVSATNPKRDEMKSPPVDCLVDTGSEVGKAASASQLA